MINNAPHIALITARAARVLDDDLPPLELALRETGAAVDVVDWDDAAIDWSRFDLALLRSTWDYSERRHAFLAWAERAAACTTLLNPPDVLRWNTDKHYLADLQRRDIAIVPSAFIEPGEDAHGGLDAFLADTCGDATEFVVKPSVGAGSRDAQRYARDDRETAIAHIERLQDAQRSVLLQPYLARVDEAGETALMYFDGAFSHAIRKGPLLRRGDAPTRALFATETITARVPRDAERDLADRVLAAMPFAGPLLYARVDLIDGDDGAPRLLELELVEPSLFFAHSERSVTRFAQAIVATLERRR